MEFDAGISMSLAAVTETPSLSPSLSQGVSLSNYIIASLTLFSLFLFCLVIVVTCEMVVSSRVVVFNGECFCSPCLGLLAVFRDTLIFKIF